MKVFISADMEGTAGVTDWEQVLRREPEYVRFRRLMTEEVNAAVLGAIEGGAKEIMVSDSHGDMRNILIEELHPQAQLISGSPKPYRMMQGIDPSFDAVFFTGYHAYRGDRERDSRPQLRELARCATSSSGICWSARRASTRRSPVISRSRWRS